MIRACFAGFRRTVAALAVLAASAGAAAAQDSVAFTWPDNPFATTLPDVLFADTGEARFEKAGRVFLEAMGGIGHEVGQIASFPVRDPLAFGTFALGVGALVLVDIPATTLYQKTVLPIGEAFNLPKLARIPHTTIDEQYIALALAGSYGYGFAFNDERAQVAALLSTKAIAYSFLTSHVLLKAGFGRLRPVSDLAGHKGRPYPFSRSPFNFFRSTGIHFDSNPYATGMPSFHFTLYFATARVYSGVYDNYFVPYGIAAALALQAAEGHNHWVSDMVAGALIGTGIGNVVLNSYQDRRGVSAMVMPIATSRGAGLGFQMTF